MRLDPESVQAVARAIVEMMRSDEALPVPADESALLTAAEVARRFDVSRDWVYAHAGELDVIKLGKGRKPRLRFDAARVERALAALATPPTGADARARARVVADGGAQAQGLDALPAEWRDAMQRPSRGRTNE